MICTICGRKEAAPPNDFTWWDYTSSVCHDCLARKSVANYGCLSWVDVERILKTIQDKLGSYYSSGRSLSDCVEFMRSDIERLENQLDSIKEQLR